MKIKVTNFGPVANASLEIAPFTIIIGRNNLGKSFMSQLVFSVTSSLRSRHTWPYLDRSEYAHRYGFANLGLLDLPTQYMAEAITEDNRDLQRAIRAFCQGESSREIAIQHLADFTCKFLARTLSQILSDQLERTFGVRTGDLVRLGSNKSTMSIWMSPRSHFLITFGAAGKLSARLRLSRLALAAFYSNQELVPSPDSMRTKARVRHQTEILIELIKASLFTDFDISRAFYLPAGRGGLIDSWETISSAWINLAPISIPRGITMPPLPGTSAMFYNILQSLSGKRKGEFHSTHDAFTQILGGDLEISIDQALRGKRNIDYVLSVNGQTKKINIIHAASMVKEMGPLYLIIKEVLQKKDLFIVEEPESHLHPTAQRDFMRIMVSLAEQGVYNLFTTHSDLLLRSVGHFVYESSKKKNEGAVPISSLSVNLMKETPTGSISRKVRLTRKGAIDKLPTFDEVINELYDEELRLDQNS